MKLYLYILFIAISLLVHPSNGQGWSIERYTEDNGLPTDYLYAITDYKEEILIGSDQGLITFDGEKFKVLDHLSRTYPVYIYNISKDSLLISTYRNGLYSLKEDKLLHIDQKLKTPKIFGQGNNYLLFDNRKKCVLVESLSEYPKLFVSKFRNRNCGYNIHVSKEGVYIYQEDRLEIFDWDGKDIAVLDFKFKITSTYSEGDFKFIGHTKGRISILDYKGNSTQVDISSQDPIYHIYNYSKNTLLVVNRKENSTQFFLLKFSDGFGTLENSEMIFESNFEINNIHINSGVIYVGSFGNGLHVLRPNSFKTTVVFPEHLARVESIIPTQDGSIYCKTNNSIFEISQKNSKPKVIIENRAIGLFTASNNKNFLSSLTDLYDDELGLIATQGVISDFTTTDSTMLGYSKYSFFNIDLTSATVNEYFTIAKKNLYYGRINCGVHFDKHVFLGTDNGIVSLVDEGSSWTSHEDSVLISAFDSKRIQDLLFRRDTLYIVADGQLFLYVEKMITQSKLTYENNLRVNTLHKDSEENLFVGTNNGFYYYKDYQTFHYHAGNGLSSNQVYDFYIDENAYLWITTGKGIDRVKLDNLKMSKSPSIYFGEVNIEPNKASFLIKSELGTPIKNQVIQFKINEEDWNELDHSDLVLHNLEPDDYNIQFRSKQTNSPWSKSIEHKFTVHPRWYQTSIFKILCGLLGFYIIFLSFRWRLKRVEAQRKTLEEEVTKRKALALKVSNLREEISQDFHDDIGNKIASIGSISASILASTNHYEESKIKAISKLSSEIYDNTKDFVWLLNPDNNNIHSLCLYIRDYAEQFFDMFDDIDFFYESDLPYNKTVSYEVIKNIVLAFKEITINTVKHSGASSFVLKVRSDKNQFIMEASDNGRGYSDVQTFKGSGLGHISKRMDRINAGYTRKTNNGVQYSITINTPD